MYIDNSFTSPFLSENVRFCISLLEKSFVGIKYKQIALNEPASLMCHDVLLPHQVKFTEQSAILLVVDLHLLHVRTNVDGIDDISKFVNTNCV